MCSIEDIDELFINETLNSLDDLEMLVIKIESKSDRFLIQEIARIMHSIKGNSMYYDLSDIYKIMHANEDIMLKLGEANSLKISKEDIIDTILISIDFVKHEIYCIQNGEAVDTAQKRSTIKKINNTLKKMEG